jgi:hypothetical protein
MIGEHELDARYALTYKLITEPTGYLTDEGYDAVLDWAIATYQWVSNGAPVVDPDGYSAQIIRKLLTEPGLVTPEGRELIKDTCRSILNELLEKQLDS